MNTKIFFYIICIATYISCADKSIQSEEKLPNIVYIFTDDLGYGDLGAFGAKDIKTPHIDRLAYEGIKFTDFYSASSVCSPSRAALMTGKYPQRMGINAVFFPESFTGMPNEEVTIAELLKQKNYATGMVGKWHLGHREKFLPLQQGFDSYFGIPYSNDMESVVYMRDNEVVDFDVDQTQTTKLYTEEALSYIDRNKDEPFFLYVSHNQPHVPIYASDDFLGSSERGLYGDVIQEIDWSVGQIIEKLEEHQLLENTLIIFSSDNGPWLVMEDHAGSAGVLREGKQFTFDGGMRVPTVAMWKGSIKEGTVSNDLATQMDWFPTIANLTNTELPNTTLDGRDISMVLNGTGKRDGDSFLFFDGATLEGYRKGKYKYKKPYKGFKGANWKQKVPPHNHLLINMNVDPGERINLYDSLPEVAAQMIDDMNTEYKSLGDLPESLVVKSSQDNSHYTYLKEKLKNEK